jgi:hypothetical protein
MVKFVVGNLLLKTISLSHENLARDLNKKKGINGMAQQCRLL